MKLNIHCNIIIVFFQTSSQTISQVDSQTGVVEKTVPRWNQGIKGVNPPLHECVCFNNLYITRTSSDDVNILGGLH